MGWRAFLFIIPVIGGLTAASFVFLEPAFAMAVLPKGPRGGPAPLIGGGLAAIGVAGAVWLARKFRRNG